MAGLDPSRIRNVDWEQLQLVDWLEVGGTLVFVLTDGVRNGIALADPLFGWT